MDTGNYNNLLHNMRIQNCTKIKCKPWRVYILAFKIFNPN